ncbi:M48 family metallopeptidase [Geotalea toluenoxydans]|uniref:M48 family metallopeptidase n=1 Tax=Geotalea toluenoxydans TaxID=421624 RepID=UPI0006D00C52|nr:M48 family metallopeptidase [Geotalea toluenoxydans]
MGRFHFFFLSLLLLFIGNGCAVNPERVGGFNLISVEEEKQLGEKFAAEIEKEQKVVKDPEVQAYINRIGEKLLTGVEKVEFPYTFKVVKDDNINAFAIPGGHTYVNTGLIKAAESEDELAAVMAHEINHVVARHSTRQLTQQYGYSLLLQLVLGQDPNLLAQLASQLFGKAGSLYYSRGMESQADYLGVKTMYNAGYNPAGMEKFFQKLQAENKQEPGKLTKFLSSHPLTSERIQNVKAEIGKLPPKPFGASQASPEFSRIKAKLQQQ